MLFGIGFGVFLSRKFQKAYLVAVALILVLVSAIRDISVGTDTKNYYNYFQSLSYIDPEHRKEFGWDFINRLVEYFGGGFEVVLLLASILVVFPVFWVAWKNKNNPMLVLFCFYALGYYTYSLNISRQVISISILTLGLLALKYDRKAIFVAMLIVASFFHVLALILLPLIFLSSLPDDKRKLFLFYVTAVILAYFIRFPLLYFLAPVFDKAVYVVGYEESASIGGLIFAYHILFLFMLYAVKQVSFEVKLFFACVVFFLLINGFPYSNRLLMFYDVSLVFSIPYVLYFNRFRDRFFVPLTVSVFMIGVFSIRFGGGEIVPYKTIFG